MARALTDKQRRFVEEYCVDWNATQAAMRAGYSTKTAHATGPENLKKPGIAEAIGVRMAELREKAGVTKEMVLREYARLAFADIRDTVAWRAIVTELSEDEETGEPRMLAVNNVELRNSADLGPEVAAAIKSVSISATGVLKLEMHDKKGALDALAKEMGLFIERHEHTGKDGGPIEVRDDRELARRAAFLLRSAKPNGSGRAPLNGHGGDGPSAVDSKSRPAN